MVSTGVVSSNSMVIDVGVLMIVVLSVIRGTKRGFLKVGAGAIASIIGAIIGGILSLPISKYLYESVNGHTKLVTIVTKGVTDKITKLPNNKGLDTVLDVKMQVNMLNEVINNFNSITKGSTEVLSKVENTKQMVLSDFVQVLVGVIEPLVLMGLRIIVFIALVIILRVILKLILTGILNTIFKIPLLSKVDSLAGGILGSVEGLVISVSLVGLVYSVGVISRGTELINLVSGSMIFNVVKLIMG